MKRTPVQCTDNESYTLLLCSVFIELVAQNNSNCTLMMIVASYCLPSFAE